MHESELMRLLEGTADAAFAVDPQGRIRTWNKAAARMFGCDASSVLERPCAAVVNGHSASGTQVCKQDCFTLRRAGSRRSDHGSIANFDMQARPKRRPPFWVNLSVLVAIDPHTERRLVSQAHRAICC